MTPQEQSLIDLLQHKITGYLYQNALGPANDCINMLATLRATFAKGRWSVDE